MAEPTSPAPLPARPRRRGLIAGAGVAALVGGVAAAWWSRQGAGPSDAHAAALFGLRCERPGGGALALADFKGRPLLVNFWATWCPPCIEEMPLLDAFYRERSGNGWQVVGLALDKGPAVQSFLARTPVGFPIGLLGVDGMQVMRGLGNTGGGLPFTVVVDRGAHIHASRMGQVSHADLNTWAQAL